jgi:O-antigen ligase
MTPPEEPVSSMAIPGETPSEAGESGASLTVEAIDDAAPANGASRRSGHPRRRSADSAYPVQRIWLIVAFAALVGMSLLGPFMTYSSTNGVEGQAVRQVGYIAIALLTVIALRGWRVRRRLQAVPWPMIFALAWCWLSMIWAIEPSIALRRVLLLTIVTWSIFALVRQIGYTTSLLVVRGMLLILLAANWATVLNDPPMGIHQIDTSGEDSLVGDWRGMMEHKNIAGLTCALTVILFAFDHKRMPQVIRFGVLAAAGVFLWFTHSRTSIAACAGALGAGVLYSFYALKWRPFVIAAVTGATLLGAMIQNVISDPFMRVSLEDPDVLSGRTVIWEALWGYYRYAPYLGAGYGSFWDIGPASPITQFGRGWLLEIAQGHNGYLDLLVTIGPIGLALCVYSAFVWPILRLLSWQRGDGQIGTLLLSLLVFLIGHNATESTLFDRDSIGQVFVVVVLAMVFLVTEPGRRVPSGSVDLLAWATRDEGDRATKDGERRAGGRPSPRRSSGSRRSSSSR